VPVKRRKKPIVIYDGNCGFCRTWIERWREITGERVEYAASRDVGHFFPDVDPKLYVQTVVLVDTDGSILTGAVAVFRALAHANGWGWPLALYERVPGAKPVAEACYRFVATRRRLFSAITRVIWGTDVRLPSYHLVRWTFLRALGVIYFIAFASLWMQADGLVGTHGILPAESWLVAVREYYGLSAYWRAPSVFWFGASDQALNFGGAAGLVASGMLFLNRAPRLAAFVAWGLYLSYFTVGGIFLSFQWDTLLLETGFLAILFAPSGVRPRLEYERPPSRTVIWLYRWLLFRLMFLSGVVKLASGDAAWWDLSALNFHYETQPLPSWTSWYAHNLPDVVHRLSTGTMFFIELVV
jgi:predicted DCC family thiol-disulfide oxidoreductase YuxK